MIAPAGPRNQVRQPPTPTGAARGVELPPRYRSEWTEPFQHVVGARLLRGITILDIGSGRNPSVPASLRPANSTYIGLDVSADELEAAEPGSYDRHVVTDVAAFDRSLEGQVDLAISWQVLEHVLALQPAFDNVYRYLRPGGAFVSLFSGSYSAYAILNRLLPDRVGEEIVGRVMRRKGTNRPVFPAHYDSCYASALIRVCAKWDEIQLVPLYRGATYFHFSSMLQRLYLAYEDAVSSRNANLATHYLLVATR